MISDPAPDNPAFSAPGVLDVAVLALGLLVLAGAWRARIIGPRALANLPRRDVSMHPSFIWFAAGVGTLFFTALAAALAHRAFGPPENSRVPSLREQTLPEIITYSAATLACLVFAWAVIARRQAATPAIVLLARGGSLHAAGLAALWFMFILPIVASAAILAAWVHTFVTGHPPPTLAHETLRTIIDNRGNPWIWSLVLGAVVGAPIIEEHVYRCFLQSGLLRAGLSSSLSILFVSLIFALTHLGVAPPHALAPLFVLSLAMGLAYERTGRLLVPVLIHALFNAANIALAFAA